MALTKNIFLIFLIFISSVSYANMASPVKIGTSAADVFSSKNIDILNESINITISENFIDAFYFVEYTIYSDSESKQIPLLFHAPDFKNNFKISLDGKELNLLDLPGNIDELGNFPFDNFSEYFSQDNSENGQKKVYIKWDENSGREYPVTELKYFEVFLSKGEHKINIEYTADAWSDRSGWVKNYSFIYSLYPAKFWKSFGELTVLIDSRKFHGKYSVNLDKPYSGNTDSVAVWKFSSLPSDVIKISYQPEINSISKVLLYFEPFGLTVVFSIFISFLHLLLIWNYRKNNPLKKYSIILILSSLLIPLLILIFYIYSYDIIDSLIGIHAGKYHGYNFLAIILYPVILIFYFPVMWISDKIIKRKFSSKINNKPENAVL